MIGATPQESFKGSEFQALVKQRCDQLRESGLASIGLYGVQAARRADDWVILQSLPDFEGVTRDARQTIFDAKVCSQASFALDKYRIETKGARSRQLSHMLERSRYGVRCFFLVHWNRRELSKRIEEAITYAFPVRQGHPFWESFLAGEAKVLRRTDCEAYAMEVPWCLANRRDRKLRPDVMAAVTQTATSVEITGALA